MSDAIVDAIRDRPGIRHSELVRTIGQGNGTVEHHVQGLLAERRICRHREAGATCYFAGNAVSAAMALAHANLVGRTSRTIAEALLRSPGMRLTGLAVAAAVSASTAHHHVSKLRAIGAVEEAGPSPRGLRLTASGRAGLALAQVSCGEADVAQVRLGERRRVEMEGLQAIPVVARASA